MKADCFAHGPRDIFQLVREDFCSLNREEVRLISLDPQNRVIACETVSVGDAGLALLHPKQVFASALRNSATFIVLVHNHPSGNPEPSQEDLAVTKKIAKIGRMLGVVLQDHVIVGRDSFVSLRARGVL